jgi:PIN domain nuclease of toxin-antitoxin system
MSALLVDTHVFVWLLTKSRQLGPRALEEIRKAATLNALHVSAITPWEIAMLTSKGILILERDVGEWIDRALALPGFKLEPLSPAISVASTRLPGEINSDPADRIIVATARSLGLPLVTADENLVGYSAQGYVRTIVATK